MDKNVLKKFAIESRQELMEKVSNKIKQYFVDEEFSVNQNGEVYVLINDKRTLRFTKNEYENRQLLIKRIKEITLEQVIEEVAYTWFNRIIAIRYMEIHDYLPLTKDNQSLGVRVLSSRDNTTDPEIMKISNLINPDLDIEFNKEYYGSIPNNNKRFEYILLLVCKKLGKVIPQVFDGITDYIDILIPDNLLNESGYVTKLLKDVSEDNFEQVEIIGWLYQYYNQTEKDRVISAKKAYKKNEIPYATQLFTPDWIVKYMVENSLGRYWIEHGGNTDLIKKWKYFIKDNVDLKEKTLNVSEVNSMTVKEFNNILAKRLVKLDPKDIKCIDPCCGSGHILVYMFEVLFQIYESYGYSKKDIAELILKNNLYGLDIDDRAGQLSILSVLLKAREYDKDIFNKEVFRNLNIMSIQESDCINNETLNMIKFNSEYPESLSLNDIIDYVYNNFQNAKELGSLLKIDNKDYNKILDKIKELNNKPLNIFEIENLNIINNKFVPLINEAKILSSKYEIVVTNPPYMNNSVMSVNLKNYIMKNYKNVKSDVFSAFIIRNVLYCIDGGYLGFMTPYVWMFISSYEELRKYIIDQINISSLIQLEYSAFEEATVPICTFVLNNKNDDINGNYFRLTDFTGGMQVQEKKYLEILDDNNLNYIYSKKAKDFLNIPGNPIAYWINENTIRIYNEGIELGKIAAPRKGNSTSNNNRFLRRWYEVDLRKMNLNSKKIDIEDSKKRRWYPYNKGGGYRKWYGINEYLIDWYNDAQEIRKIKSAVIANYQYFMKPGLTWSTITSQNFSIRWFDEGYIFDNGGCCIFELGSKREFLAGLLNSVVFKYIFGKLNPTLNFQSGEVAKFPVIYRDNKSINDLVKNNVQLSKEDWDSFETSWDFISHPLIEYKSGADYGKNIESWNYKIKDAYESWKANCEEKFKLLKQNEEELNKIFIDIYGLQEELTPEVDEKDITIRKANKLRDIKSLISYAVGCMFGRYSIDKEGLIFAGGDFNSIYEKYKGQNLIDENGKQLSGNNGGWAGVSLSDYKYLKTENDEIELTYSPDLDNIIPIMEENYFGDDIVTRFKKFIEVVYGKEKLYENLDFIAETLGKRSGESSEETIRRYFVNDFYNDHVKIYQKRPIYWMFDSGKKNGFKCLIYMHRYNEGLVSKIRLDYLHRMQNTYEKELKEIANKLNDNVDLTNKRELSKRQADISAKLQETNEYDEKIAHIADQRINIDLDDGIAVNYAKFSVENPKTGKDESILANSKDIVKKKKEE